MDPGQIARRFSGMTDGGMADYPAISAATADFGNLQPFAIIKPSIFQRSAQQINSNYMTKAGLIEAVQKAAGLETKVQSEKTVEALFDTI
ncbi:MAG TPA: hypothetical protein VNG29_02620, partial [Candidatus Paceibacterota bacterium]|nr:hypothetical protein [Candidatus Paceibacterota bacterium]